MIFDDAFTPLRAPKQLEDCGGRTHAGGRWTSCGAGMRSSARNGASDALGHVRRLRDAAAPAARHGEWWKRGAGSTRLLVRRVRTGGREAAYSSFCGAQMPTLSIATADEDHRGGRLRSYDGRASAGAATARRASLTSARASSRWASRPALRGGGDRFVPRGACSGIQLGCSACAWWASRSL